MYKDDNEETINNIKKATKELQKKGIPLNTATYAATMGVLRNMKKK